MYVDLIIQFEGNGSHHHTYANFITGDIKHHCTAYKMSIDETVKLLIYLNSLRVSGKAGITKQSCFPDNKPGNKWLRTTTQENDPHRVEYQIKEFWYFNP